MLISVLTNRREHTYFSLCLCLWAREYTQRLVWRYFEAHAWVVVVVLGGLLLFFIRKHCCISLLYTLRVTSVFRCHWPLNSIVMKDEHRWDSWCELGTRRGDNRWLPVYESMQKNWKDPSPCLDQEWFVVGVSLGYRWFVVLFLFVCSEGIIFVTYC